MDAREVSDALHHWRSVRHRGTVAVDLVLVVVVYVALTSGPMTGMLCGTAAGLAQDALSTGVIGAPLPMDRIVAGLDTAASALDGASVRLRRRGAALAMLRPSRPARRS